MPAAPGSRSRAAAIAALLLLGEGASAATSPTVTIPATEATPRAALTAACEGGVLQLTLRAPARPPHDVLLLELDGMAIGRVRARWQGDALALPPGSALQVGGWLAQAKPFALVADGAVAAPRWAFQPSSVDAAPLHEVLRACDLSPSAP